MKLCLFSFEGMTLKREDPVTIARRNPPVPMPNTEVKPLTSMILGG